MWDTAGLVGDHFPAFDGAISTKCCDHRWRSSGHAANLLAFAFLAFAALLGATGAHAQTHAECYNAANAQTIGQVGWTGCEGMYIVKDLAELNSARFNGYQVTYNSTSYTFSDSAHNVFTGQVTSMYWLFGGDSIFNGDIGYSRCSGYLDTAKG